MIDNSLLNKLNRYKLKIIFDVDGDVHTVQCVIRVSIMPFIKWYSNDVFYKAKDMSRCTQATNVDDAINICLSELVNRLEANHEH
jgi:hypothetical protein